jgi:hypothetical protein
MDPVFSGDGTSHWHGGGPNSMMCHYAIRSTTAVDANA